MYKVRFSDGRAILIGSKDFKSLHFKMTFGRLLGINKVRIGRETHFIKHIVSYEERY